MTQLVGPPIVAAVVGDDFHGLIEFYAGVLGLAPFGRDESWAGFDIGWPGMFEVMRRRDEGLPQYHAPGWRIGFSTGNIEASVAALEKAGQTKPDEIRFGSHGDAWCYFDDPRGGHYCVVQRGPAPERHRGHPVTGPMQWTGFVTEDLQGASRFFAGVFGYRFIGSGQTSAWFDAGWPNLVESLAFDATKPERQLPGWIPGFSVADVLRAREELISRGAKPVTDVMGRVEEGAYWAYFSDPEGNLFEITQPLGPPWPGGE